MTFVVQYSDLDIILVGLLVSWGIVFSLLVPKVMLFQFQSEFKMNVNSSQISHNVKLQHVKEVNFETIIPPLTMSLHFTCCISNNQCSLRSFQYRHIRSWIQLNKLVHIALVIEPKAKSY